MQSFKKIMEELGFNADAPLETQKAFIKNLVAAAEQTRPQKTIVKPEVQAPAVATEKHQTKGQLEFDLGDIRSNLHETRPNKKRVS